MPDHFAPSDLLKYLSVASIAATRNAAACVVEQADEASDGNSSRIWLVPLDGSAPSLFPAGTDSMPIWSPDGQELAFVSNRGGSGLQAFVMRADGGEARQVSNLKSGVYNIVWSPDGQKLLLTAKQGVDPSAKGERASPSEGKVPHVVWRLPYKMDGIGYTLDRKIHLFVIDKDGGNLVQLTDGPFDVGSAQYSPDGNRIAYDRTRVGREAHRTDIWVMDADGKNAEQLTTEIPSAQYSSWSPDGKWIAFTGSDKEGDSRSRLWLVDTRDNSMRPLGDEELDVESGSSVYWSEESTVLFFVMVRRGLQEIVRISLAD